MILKAARNLVVAALFALAAATSLSAQNNGKSVSIQIVATVPAVLKLSLDFSADATTQVAGFIPGASATSASARAFEIKDGATVGLGNARLVSNVSSSYSVNVYSANGGALVDAAGSKVNYQLQLGDKVANANGGTFSFRASGKSTRDGNPLAVALSIPSVPAGAASGFYTDSLMFSVAAN